MKKGFITMIQMIYAFIHEHLTGFKVNGFSNRFWGWGGEDDDMANRIFANNLYISRYPVAISRYL